MQSLRSKRLVSIARSKETFESRQSSHLVEDVTEITVTNNHLNNLKNEDLTNRLFQDLMLKKSLEMPSVSDQDLNLDLDVYEEVVITTPQKDLSPDTTKWLQSNIDHVGPFRQLFSNEGSSDTVNDVQQLVNNNQTTFSASGVFEVSNQNDLSPNTTKWLQSNIDQIGPSRQLVNYEVSSDSVNDIQQLVDSDDSTSSVSGVIGQGGIRKKKIFKAERASKKLKIVSGKGKKVQPCVCIFKKTCHNKCGEIFSENDRHNIFNEFWKLCDKSRQRDFLLKCVKQVPVKRKRIKGPSRRTLTNKYFLIHDNEETEVCQQFILTTLNISQKMLSYTVNNKSPINVSSSDKRGKHSPPNKNDSTTMKQLDNFIQKLPAVSSHYCRASTVKKYLPAEFQNILRLYSIYTNYCQTNGHYAVSKYIFRNVFTKKYNLGFHLPKKDKCRICTMYDNNINDNTVEDVKENQEKHLKEKEECKTMFLQHQNSLDNESLCISFDLQKVLNTPAGNNMNLYYSRKYSTYNCTVYESKTRNSYCYLWGETTGNRGCNEIVSCIFKYLIEIDTRKDIKSVFLFCDSCAGQNKNRAMFSMLYYVLKYKFSTITNLKITFLLPGHTYMPVDSVHATIERFVDKKTIWGPSEWPTLIRNARMNPRPLEVIELDSNDILDWKNFSTTTFPNNLKTFFGKKVFTSKIRCLLFNKTLEDVDVLMSTSYNENNLISINIPKKRGRSQQVPSLPEKCYLEKIPISKAKYSDLTKLCNDGIIPQKYHAEYFEMMTDENVRDCLNETDEED